MTQVNVHHKMTELYEPDSALHDDCWYESEDTVKRLLQKGEYDVNSRNKFDHRPIQLARCPRIIVTLLRKGAFIGSDYHNMYYNLRYYYWLTQICSARQPSNSHSILKLLPPEILKRICFQLSFYLIGFER